VGPASGRSVPVGIAHRSHLARHQRRDRRHFAGNALSRVALMFSTGRALARVDFQTSTPPARMRRPPEPAAPRALDLSLPTLCARRGRPFLLQPRQEERVVRWQLMRRARERRRRQLRSAWANAIAFASFAMALSAARRLKNGCDTSGANRGYRFARLPHSTFPSQTDYPALPTGEWEG